MADTNAEGDLVVRGGRPLDDVQSRIQSFEKGQSAGIGALEGVTADTSRKIGGFEAAINRMGSPPKLETVPPPQPKMTDPLQIWGSMAMILAAVGSLKSRQPLTTAMNAAAAVMQGYKKGDTEAANAAYQTWKVANENAKAIFQSEMDTYKTILSGYERREGLAIQEGGMKERTIRAQLSAAAAAFGDENSLLIAKEHSIEKFQDHLDKKQSLLDKGIGTENDIERKKIEAERTIKLTQSPEYKTMSLEERAEKMAEIHGEESSAGVAKKKLQDVKKQDAKYRLDEADRQIDDVMKNYGNMSVDPTGLSGMVARPVEALRNRLPSDVPGATGDTSYNDFATKIQTIRALVVPLISGNVYRTNPTLRAQIDAIVPGLGRFESAQHTMQSLQSLKEMLPRLRGEFGVDEAEPQSAKGPSRELGSDPHRPIPLHSKEDYDAAPSKAWISGVDKNGKSVITQKP